MRKYRLVTPGPVMAPPETLLELAKPVIHHRTAENKKRFADAVANLKKVFVTESDVVILTSSGTGAMEAAVANLVAPGKKAIVASAGKFGERWAELWTAHGGEVIHIQEPYGKAIDPNLIEQALERQRDTAAVFTTLCETSTAVVHDVEAIGKIVAKTPAIFAVDGISGVAADECRTDAWSIDMLAVGSQKALMLPPGLAFLTVSAKARKAIEANSRPGVYYFDLRKALKSAAESDTPFTPAHTLIAALGVSLQQILVDGIETVWRRTASLARAMRAGAQAAGLKLVAERPSAGVTALYAPDGVEADKWAKHLEKKFGLKVASGQGPLKGKIIRVAHMGYMDEMDVVGIAACLEWSLADMGHKVEFGMAPAAAAQALAKDLSAEKAG